MKKPENQHSENSVHWERINQNLKIIGHNSGALIKVVHGMILQWKVFQMTTKTDGDNRSVELEIPCI